MNLATILFLSFVKLALNVKSSIFWDMALHSPKKVSWRSGGTFYLHLLMLKIVATLVDFQRTAQ